MEQLKSDIQLDEFQQNLADRVLEQLDYIGQSALEVMTSGGKSYIAAYIMFEYMNKHRDCDVLWIAPRSAINNVKEKIFSKTALKNKIKYIGYEELSRGNTFDTEDSNIKLIVFDECHKAYAKKTFESLTELLDRLGDIDRLAMSATPIRYDGLNTFSVLVPKVTEPIQFDIKDASEHDLLPELTYVLANVSISPGDFRALDKYKKLTKNNEEADKLFQEVMETLSSFKFNLKNDLGELLKNYITSNGENGERHIAFFNSIATLREMKDAIKEAFEEKYAGCNINILEYHSGVSQEENNKAFKQFVIDEPEPYRIDVMLSVDKATESIHPDNVRSVLMFRGTQSIRVYLQQMGRGVMLKSYHPEDVVIFDFADSISCVGYQTTLTGKKASEDRIANDTDYVNSIDAIRRAIMYQFGYSKGIETKIGLQRIQNCMDKLKEISRLTNIRILINSINKAKFIHKKFVEHGDREDTDNIYYLIYGIMQEIELETIPLSAIWKKGKDEFDKHWNRVLKEFKIYQKMYLSDEVNIPDELREYFDSLGHSAYLAYGNGNITSQMLDDIDYIKAEINKSGSISNSTNNHAKHKLKKLRLQYAKNNITPNVCVYARRNGIDIEMSSLDMPNISELCETDKDKEIANAFKPILRALLNTDKSIQNGGILNYQDWIEIRSKLFVVQKKFKENDIANIYSCYIRSRFGYILNCYKLYQNEIEGANKLVSAYIKIENNKTPDVSEEDYIFEHSYSNGCDILSEFEQSVLKELGITKGKYVEVLEEKTDFMIKYKLALSGDTEAIKKMLGYNIDKLDKKRKKLLNAAQFKNIQKEVKDIIGADVLLSKARCMYGSTNEYKKLIKDISNAIDDGSIGQIDIAITPFRSYDEQIVRGILKYTHDEFIENLKGMHEIIESNRKREEGTKQMTAKQLENAWKLTKYKKDTGPNIKDNLIYRLVISCNRTNSCTKMVLNNVLQIKNLDQEYKYRLSEIYNQLN